MDARGKEIVASRDLRYVLRSAVAFSMFMLLPGFATLTPAADAQAAGESYRQTVLSIQQHIEQNDLEGARALIAKASKQFPADGGIENLLGVVEIQQGHTALAKQAFSAAIKHSPKLVGAYLNLGRIDMQTAASDSNTRAEATRIYEKILQIEPSNPEANYQAATLLMAAGNYQRSLERLAKLSAGDRSQAGAQALLCADEAGLGHKEAADRAAATLAANPQSTEQDLLEIMPALRSGHRDDLAEIILTAIAEHHPLSVEGLRIEGLTQEAQGKLEQARATLERAFAKDPSSIVLLKDLARVAEAAKDYRGALGYIAHARDLQPKDASLPYRFGGICLKLNLIGEARKALGDAVKLAPDNPQYNLSMGVVSSYAQDPTEAFPYLEKYHALRPKDAEGILALGSTYLRAKDFDNASKWLKLAANTPSTAATAHYDLGHAARLLGKLDEAAAQLTQSITLKPDQPEVLAELGQTYVQMKKYPEAEKQLDRAIKLAPDNYTANFGLMQLYARTDDARRDAQSKYFRELRDKDQEQYREMMRAIEIDPKGDQKDKPDESKKTD